MKTTKLKLIGVISIFAFILFTTIGYSALNTNLTISGDAHVRVTKELRISNIELISLTNGAYETYGSDYSKNTTSMHVTLPNTTSTATYKVTVINKTGNYFSPNEIIEQTKTNSNVTYELSGISSYNIYSGETLTFNVIFKTSKTNQKQDLVLEYNLKEITTTMWSFGYTGGEQTFTVPYNASYKIETWGAQGGTLNTNEGGLGGYSAGNITLEQNKKLYVYVGSQANGTTGGYNGGAAGGTSTDGAYTGGGGATDIRLVNGTWSDFDSLKSRIMVAGAGAGTGDYWGLIQGGSSGGLNGYDGAIGYCSYISSINTGIIGTGGTQTFTGNSGYRGGFGYATDALANYGTGAGSGYYGGSTGAVNDCMVASGGGGSSFISGHAGCDAINASSTSSSITHSGQSVHYSGYKFTNTIIVDGQGYNWTTVKGSYTGMPTFNGISTKAGNSGNGYAKITLLLEESAQEIEISNIELVSLTNGAYESSNNGFSKTTTDINVTLPNTNSTAMYKVTITNKTSNYFSPIEIVEKLNSNSNVKYAISGLSLNNVYQGSEYSFNITLSTSVANQSTNLILRYKFEKVPTTMWVYDYTGGEQSFTTPYNASYKVELWGAQGGTYNTAQGGNGGYTKGNIELSKNAKLYVYVGSQGSIGTGGYNGGANSGTANYYTGGGGATDIRLVNGTWSDFNSLKSRIMVAGAGAGSGIFTGNLIGGAAGGLIGYEGTSGRCEGNTNQLIHATGGTQTSGGNGSSDYSISVNTSLSGQFGYSVYVSEYVGDYGTGGGSGYYGGGSAQDNACVVGSGAGGSSFISGHNGCNAINSSSTASSITHSGQSVHYSGYKFTNTVIVDGQGYNWTTAKGSYTGMPNHAGTSTITGNTGNGYAKITLIPRN